MTHKKMNPIHPGEILAEEFLDPLKISQYKLAKDISVPARRINEIVHGTRSITADTALRLAKFFGNSAQFWLNLQSHYELEVQEDILANRLEHEVRRFQFAVWPFTSGVTKAKDPMAVLVDLASGEKAQTP